MPSGIPTFCNCCAGVDADGIFCASGAGSFLCVAHMHPAAQTTINKDNIAFVVWE